MVKNNKRIKQSKIVSDDVVQVRNLLILLVAVVIVCVGIFFLTEKMLEKENKTETTKEVEFNYDIATVGTMFNRPEEEYYVLIYSGEEDSSLTPVLDSYRSSDNYVKTYFIDLDLKVNSIAKGDKLNKEPKNSNEVSVTEPTLYMIKKGKVSNCYSGVDSISDILK